MSEKVLLVDDEKEFLKSLKDGLDFQQFGVFIAMDVRNLGGQLLKSRELGSEKDMMRLYDVIT